MDEDETNERREQELRWLMASRPETAADDGWAASEAGERALHAIHDATRRPLRSRRHRVSWSVGIPIGVAGVAAAAVVLATATGDPSHTHQPEAIAPTPKVGAIPTHVALAAYDNCGQMLAGLRSHTAAHVTDYGVDGPTYYGYADGAVRYDAQGTVASAPNASGAAGSAAPAHSTTNNQVTDVDEPDTVKSDGRRVIILSGGILRVIDATTRKMTASLDLSLYSGADSAQLLVSGDRALVILGSYGYGVRPFYAGPYIPYYQGGTAGYVLVDLSGSPSVLATMQTTGSPVDARLIGSTVRFVVTSSPKFSFPAVGDGHSSTQRKAIFRKVVQHAPLSAWLPQYTLNDNHGSRTLTVPCTDVRHPEVYTGLSMTTVYTVDLASGFGDLSPTSLAADGSTVYSTARNLYIASTGDKNTTLLHRYDITATGSPTYLGTGTVPGGLLDSYSMSDYAGHLRVVTTYRNTHGRTTNSLYELDDATLRVVGEVGGLGRNEQVYAVRFLDALGYVVTYRQVDPLYVLDLHDPARPRVVDALKATGYSAYLHPVGAGRLLGVGAQVDAYNEPSGLKLSLFDVAHPSRAKQLASIVRKNSWGGDIDPHAFLYWPATDVVVVPLQSWNGGQSGALVVRIAGDHLHVVGLARNPATLNTDSSISRTFVIGDTLWTMSDGGLDVRSLSTLKQQAWLPFS